MSRKDFCFKMLFFATMGLGIFQISYGIDPSVLYHLSEEGSKNSGSESASRNSPMDEDEDKDEEASNQVLSFPAWKIRPQLLSRRDLDGKKSCVTKIMKTL